MSVSRIANALRKESARSGLSYSDVARRTAIDRSHVASFGGAADERRTS